MDLKEYGSILESVPGVSGWVLQRRHASERQRYLLSDKPESERTVHSTTLNVTLLHDHADGQGEARFTVFGKAPLERRKIENAVYRASLQGNPAYSLPEPRPISPLAIHDPELAQDVRATLDRMQDQIFDSVAKEKGIRLSASEIFVRHVESEILTSTGVAHAGEETSLLMEIVLLATSGHDEAESYGAYRTRRLGDLRVPDIVSRHATRARNTLEAELPETRLGTVVLSEGAFIPLLGPFRFATSGDSIYRKISPLKVGQPLLGNRRITGDALTLSSDATLAFATESRPVDDDGLALGRVSAVEDGEFKQIVASKRFADYLSIQPTGAWHNHVLAAGETPRAELLDPGDTPLYHIVEFSWLNPSAVRGSFSTEIRLGYEIRPSGTRVIKGGSLSGNVYDAFAAAHFARETELLESYHGPVAIRFDALQVTGG